MQDALQLVLSEETSKRVAFHSDRQIYMIFDYLITFLCSFPDSIDCTLSGNLCNSVISHCSGQNEHFGDRQIS